MDDMNGFVGIFPTKIPPPYLTAPGYQGQEIIDVPNQRLYKCIGSSYWAYAQLIPLIGRLRTCTYVSNGDVNDLFYFLGQLATGTWANPQTQGLITVTPVPNGAFNTGADTADKFFNRSAATHVDISGSANLSYVIDLGPFRTFSLTQFSFRWRPDTNTFSPTGWQILGSSDNSNFTTLITVTGQTAVAGNWVNSTCAASNPYRYWKFLQTSSDQPGFLTTGQIAMYGTLTY